MLLQPRRPCSTAGFPVLKGVVTCINQFVSGFGVRRWCTGSAEDGRRWSEGPVALTGRMGGQKDLVNITNHSNRISFLPTLVFLPQCYHEKNRLKLTELNEIVTISIEYLLQQHCNDCKSTQSDLITFVSSLSDVAG